MGSVDRVQDFGKREIDFLNLRVERPQWQTSDGLTQESTLASDRGGELVGVATNVLVENGQLQTCRG